jgi:alginate O-acetyltransferase complex protein AlgI
MDFIQLFFLFVFLPLALLVYFVAGRRGRLVVALVASLIFFAWGQLLYVPLMVVLVLANFAIARAMDATHGDVVRAGRWFWGGIVLDVGALFFFKFLTGWGNSLLGGLPLVGGWLGGLSYPLGLSYVSFQLISYLADVRKGTLKAEDDLLRFSTYVMLFPKIVAGPITRYGSQRAALEDPIVTPDGVAAGVRRFLAGFAKKVLVADTLARVVAAVFDMKSPDVAPQIAWLALVAYALQIYFDFSGYADMAIGLGRMLGFTFLENFDFPYLARSIGDFWRRWHISLSSWFRDYVFYPLERRRLKWIGQPLNILIVFALTGLWHGMTWTFLAWGMLHGLALVFENSWAGRRLRQVWVPIQHGYALAVILLGWVFFRSQSLAFAWAFLGRLAGNAAGVRALPFEQTSPLPILEPTFWLALGVGLILALPVSRRLQALIARLSENRPLVGMLLQGAWDLALLFFFVVAIASIASGNFAPGIYGRF